MKHYGISRLKMWGIGGSPPKKLKSKLFNPEFNRSGIQMTQTTGKFNINSTEHSVLVELISDYGLTSEKEAIIKLYEYLKLHYFEYLTPEHIQLTSSSGSSVVLLFKDRSHPVVYQYYRSQKTYEEIIKMQHSLKNNSNQSLSINARHQLKYDINDYTVTMVNSFPTLQTIVWERIVPLHDVPSQTVKQHINRLFWDLGKALNGLHTVGYSHGDSRYDNIGLKNGKFVLFDYNLSTLEGDYDHDYELLADSLKFNLDIAGVPRSSRLYGLLLGKICIKMQMTTDQMIDLFENNKIILLP